MITRLSQRKQFQSAKMSSTPQEKGQTLPRKDATAPVVGKEEESHEISTALTCDHNESKDDTQEWEFVERDECNDEARSLAGRNTTSIHFDVTLGWGQRKHTLYSFDYNQTVGCARSQVLDDEKGDEAKNDSKGD
ncbi:hypothetical protein F4804DRAFT_312802 [Jackrogersella minutella]|nr:hypothetical protein F4804DRAFT_312802 [Jackrogersella minutella]